MSGEHYTRNTVSTLAWCARCQARTAHRVDGTRLGPCLDCIARLEEDAERRRQLARTSPLQSDLFAPEVL